MFVGTIEYSAILNITVNENSTIIVLILIDQIHIAPSIDKGRIWIKILDDNLEAYIEVE